MAYMYQMLKMLIRRACFAIADEINEKAALAIEGKLTAQDMRDGTITISNIGSVGGGWFYTSNQLP